MARRCSSGPETGHEPCPGRPASGHRPRVRFFGDGRVIFRSGARYEVASFAGGQELLDWLGQTRPSVVLVDGHMPGMDGRQVLSHLSRQPVPIPAIVVSGHDTPLDRESAAALGAVAFFSKPFDPAKLLDGDRRRRRRPAALARSFVRMAPAPAARNGEIAISDPETTIHLPAPGLRASRSAWRLFALGAALSIVAVAVLAMAVGGAVREGGGWGSVLAVIAGTVVAGLIGLIGYAAGGVGPRRGVVRVTIRLPPGRLVVEKSRPKGYRLDVAAADVAAVQVVDQFHEAFGFEILLTMRDLRVIRVVNGRTLEELESIGERIRSHLRKRR